MAVSLEPEDAAFVAFKAAFTADNGIGVNALNDATKTTGAYNSNAYLIGGFERRGDPFLSGKPTVPRIEFEAVGFAELDTPDHARVEGIVRLHIIAERETPDGFGSQQTVAIRARRVYHRAALGAQSGWSFSTVVRKRPFQAPGTPKEQHYIVEYAVVMSAGTGGGF